MGLISWIKNLGQDSLGRMYEKGMEMDAKKRHPTYVKEYKRNATNRMEWMDRVSKWEGFIDQKVYQEGWGLGKEDRCEHAILKKDGVTLDIKMDDWTGEITIKQKK